MSLDHVEPTGQPVPRIAVRYPTYFSACVERVLGYIRARVPRAAVTHVGSIPTSFHWMGTTRMSADPRDGCVDAALRYHDLENLYVLSTSIFPSASSANPTGVIARTVHGDPTSAGFRNPAVRRRMVYSPDTVQARNASATPVSACPQIPSG